MDKYDVLAVLSVALLVFALVGVPLLAAYGVWLLIAPVTPLEKVAALVVAGAVAFACFVIMYMLIDTIIGELW